MMIMDNKEKSADDEPKNVHDINSKGDSIDGTRTEKEDGQEDLSQFKLMDNIEVTENLDENGGAGMILNNRGT